MNDNLQSKLADILGLILEGVRTAGDFAMTQLPEIAQQYVMYGRIKTAVVSAVFFLLAWALLLLSRWAYLNPWNTSMWHHEQHLKRSESNIFVIVVGGIGCLIALLISVTGFDFLVWLAPKVWLLKELAALVK